MVNLYIRYFLVFFGGALIFISCKKEQVAPEEPYVCYFYRKVENNNPSIVYNGLYKFQIGNYWKYELKRYENDSLVLTDTVTETITGLYTIDSDYWWKINNGSLSDINTDGKNLNHFYIANYGECARSHSMVQYTTSDTINDPYYTHVMTFSCFYFPVSDTINTPAGSFNNLIVRNSLLYGNYSISFYKENIGKIYQISYNSYYDTTDYVESLLIDYYIQ